MCWECDGLAPPEGRFVQVGIGAGAICGLTEDGAVVCWGYSWSGLHAAPVGRFVHVDAGRPACSLRADGLPACLWGGGVAPGPLSTLAVCGGVVCGLRAEGWVQCADDSRGWPPPDAFVDLAGGPRGCCGLAADGTARCWASPFVEGDVDPPDLHFGRVAVGRYQACGIDAEGHARCWGWQHGVLGQSEEVVTRLAVGDHFWCGLRPDATLFCRGVGYSTGNDVSPRPNLEPPDGEFVDLALSDRHGCALHPDGSVECWGPRPVPRPSPGSGPFLALEAYGGRTCGLLGDGGVECWGSSRIRLLPR